MKLSNSTLKILRNFSDINNTILIRKGKSIVTVDPQKRIVADANIHESLPQDFAIYDLNKFLGVNSIWENSDLNFETDKVVFKKDSRFLDYFYSDPTVVQDAEPVRQKIPTVFNEDSIVQKFSLSEDDLKLLRQNASLLSFTHVSFVSDSDGMRVVSQDISTPTHGKFNLQVSGESKESGSYNMLFENLKILPDSYDVEVSPTVAHFVGKTTGVQYWIVMEAI